MKRHYISIPFLLVVSMTAIVSVGYCAGQGDQSIIPRWWERPRVVQKLGLSNGQVSRIKGIYRQESKQIKDLRESIREQRDNLYKLLENDQYDESKVTPYVEPLRASFCQLLKLEMLMQLKMLKGLSGKQRRELFKLQKEIREWIRSKPPGRS